MTRELKFRAWANGYEKWCKFIDYTAGVWLGTVNATKRNYTTTDVAVEQYTGLKDKNGKEIYEGDIVVLYYDKYKTNKKGERVITFEKIPHEVIFDEFGVGFMLHIAKMYNPIVYWHKYKPYQYAKVVVIGNIHENPELLEEAACQS